MPLIKGDEIPEVRNDYGVTMKVFPLGPENDLLDFLVFRRASDMEEKWSMQQHKHHDFEEYWYVIKGKLSLTWIDPNIGKWEGIDLNVGDCVSIPQGVPHQLLAYEDSDIMEVSTPHKDSDSYRINNLLRLIHKGYIKNILIGNDTCFKHRLHYYGGFGYDHFLRNILPILRYEGVTEKEIRTLLIENPARFLNIENMKH